MLSFSDIELTVDGGKIEKSDMYVSCIDYIASVSKPYEVSVKARRGNFDKEFLREDYVSKTASISFSLDNDQVKFSGIIIDFNSSVIFEKGVLSEFFDIKFGPEFFEKNQQHNKIYLNQSSSDIAKYLIDNNTNLKLTTKAEGGTSPRDFTLQYQTEGDREFFDRILSEEGIYYNFDQDEGSVVLYDSSNYSDSKVEIKVGPEIERRKFDTTQMKKYMVFDHNFESPTTDLSVDKENSDKSCFSKSSIAIWGYPGAYNKSTGNGSDAITKRLNREKAGSSEYEFEFTNIYKCIYLDACSKFKLSDLNKKTEKEYAVTSINMHLPNTGENIKFKVKAIEATITYAPEMLIPPSIPLMSAEVIGPDNSQRNYKDYSVQVKFYWQTDKEKDDQNQWLRVAQLWAGKDYGTFFRPVIGSEVIVSFLYGPNRAPVVIGCLHDAQVKYPYEDQKFCSGIITKNEEGEYPTELIFDDSKDNEKLSINTAKDYESQIQNDRTISLVEGNDQLEIQKGNRDVAVKTGDESVTLDKGDRTIKAAAGTHAISANKQTIEASQTIVIDADEGVTITCGDSQIKLSASGIEIKAPSVTIDGSGQVEVDGAMVKIEGSGLLECKGGLVTIN